MQRRKPLVLETVPAWAIDPDRKDRHTVAAALELAGLYGRWIRLSADSQRALFGSVPFGKCEVKAGPEGIKVRQKVCFGTDSNVSLVGWDSVDTCIRTGDKPAL